MSLNRSVGEPGVVIKRRREQKIVNRETPVEVREILDDRAMKRSKILDEQKEIGERVKKLRRPIKPKVAAAKPKPGADETSDNIRPLVDESDLEPVGRRR